MAPPDDIEFMAGGLISRWAREGVEVWPHWFEVLQATADSAARFLGEDRNAGPHALRRLREAQAQAFMLVRIIVLDAREKMVSRPHAQAPLLQPVRGSSARTRAARERC